ncbi:endonuclease V [Pontibacter liquoris]|uniref:endonuclease V n=1 Tax=Pontibacter liquoris TaxID=2905677 RepID=UPI003461B5D3
MLAGKYRAPAATKSSIWPLFCKYEIISNVLRTKYNVKWRFVSPGCLMDSDTATSIAWPAP